ncbi:MAG: beta strand repeat-containing protein [Vulcanimicrobiaceae bacterium]
MALMTENFQGSWQIRIYDTTGKLIDIPQADIESISLEDTLNGGSATATIVFVRNFNNIGAIANRYTVLIWFWAPGQTQPLDPYYGGHIVDYDQKQRSASGRVTAKIEGDAKMLDAAIVTEQLNPGVNGNPNMDAGQYVAHLLSTYQPANFSAPSIPGTTFNMFPTNFDASKLGAAVDTVLKQGRDLSGNIWTWFVRTRHDLTRQVVVQVDQNPNSVTGPLFKLLFLESQLDQYGIQNLYRNIVNVVAVYGSKDPQTGLQVFGVYQDAASVTEFGPIEDKISVPALTTADGCQAYATTWLTLHAYPQAQGSARLLVADPTILGGTWVQVMETPATASAPAVIKQVRVASVKVTISKNRIEQVISTSSPVPYLDDAVYRLGQHVQVQQAIINAPVPANRQTLYVRAGGTLAGTSSSPAQIALTACEAVFPTVGIVYAAALPLTTLTDDSGGPNNGQTGDGAYTISVTSTGAYVITKGTRPANSPTQQNLLAVTVIAGVPWPSDIRVLQGQPGFSSLLSAPALASGSVVSMPTPPNAGSGAYDQPIGFSLVTPAWANADPAFSYLEIGAVPHGAATAIAAYTTLQPTATGVYNGTVPGLGAGTAYDLYVRGHDNLDRPTPWLLLGTTLQNAVTVSNPSLPKMPAGAAITVSAVTEVVYESGMHTAFAGGPIGLAPVVETDFTLGDANTPPATQWGYQFIGYVRQTGTTAYARVPQGRVDAASLTNASAQSVRFHLTPGEAYDGAVALADAQGNETPAVALFTDYSVAKMGRGDPIGQIIGPGHLYGGSDPSITTQIELRHIPDDTLYAKTNTSHVVGGVAYNYKGVWVSTTAYVQGEEVVYGDSYWLALLGSTNSAPATGNANWQVVGTYSGFDGAWVSTTNYPAGAEVTYNDNFWVCVVANSNSAPATGNANWQIAGPTSLDAIPDGTLRGAVLNTVLTGNVPDLGKGILNKTLANIANVSLPVNIIANSDTFSGWVLSGGSIGPSGPNGAQAFEVTGTGASGQSWTCRCAAITVTGGEVVSLSGWANTLATFTDTTGDIPRFLIWDATHGAEVRSIDIPSGVQERLSDNGFVVPAGCTELEFWVHPGGGITLASGAILYFSQMQCVVSATDPGLYISSSIANPGLYSTMAVDPSNRALIDLAQSHENKTADYIAYTAGGTVDSLKPAEAGADVTSTHTANDTAHVNTVAAASISPISTLMPAEAGANVTETRYAAGTGTGGAQRIASAIAANMNSSGQSLLVQFPGGYIGTDGALTNVDGASSTQSYPLPAGTTIEIVAQIAKGASTNYSEVVLGNYTNGYGLMFEGGGGLNMYLVRYVGSTAAVIGSAVPDSPPTSTNYATFRLTIRVIGASDNQIQGTIDGTDPNAGAIITDSSLDLTSGTWPITLYTGGSAGKVLNLHVSTADSHYLGLPPAARTALNPAGQVIGSVYDGTTALTPANLTTAVDTSGNVKNLGGTAAASITPIATLMPAEAGADVTSTHTANDTAHVNTVAAASISPIATLMPAEAGADVTSTHTANDTAHVNAVAAATVSQGAGRANAALDSSGRVIGSVYDGTTALTPANLTSVILPTAPADNSFLQGNTVGNRHILSSAVGATQIATRRFSTTLLNTNVSAAEWDLAGAAQASGAVLTNGDTYTYNTGAAIDAGSGTPTTIGYNLPASSSVTLVLTHLAFTAGGNGTPAIFFTGNTASGTISEETTPISGSSTCSVSTNSLDVPRLTNGATVAFSDTTGEGPSATYPIALDLTSVNCPTDTYGNTSSLSVNLLNPSGVVVASWTGITAAGSLSYAPGTAGPTGTYTWNVWAVPASTGTMPANTSSSMDCTFSGTVSYWTTTGGSGSTYVLAADGVTQRTSTSDGNILFTQISPNTLAFKVYNSDTAQLGFTIGVVTQGV